MLIEHLGRLGNMNVQMLNFRSEFLALLYQRIQIKNLVRNGFRRAGFICSRKMLNMSRNQHQYIEDIYVCWKVNLQFTNVFWNEFI